MNLEEFTIKALEGDLGLYCNQCERFCCYVPSGFSIARLTRAASHHHDEYH